MCLHATALFIHTFFLLACQCFTVYAFFSPSDTTKSLVNYSRMVLYFAQSASQAIVIYLFLAFSKPVSLKTQVEESEGSEYEDEFDKIRDPNLDMMYYVKKMPKMQRLKDVSYDIDRSQGGLAYLFDETENDNGEFELVENDYLGEDA